MNIRYGLAIYLGNLNKMKRELVGKVKGAIPSKNSPTRVPKPDLPNIDIAAIGASAFHRHVRRKDTEVFMTSLHEID